MKTKNKNRIDQFLQYFGVSKPYMVIFIGFLLKKTKIEKFSYLRGEPYFFKINKYLFLGA